MSEDKGLSSNDVIGRFYQRLEQRTGAAWVGMMSMLFDSEKGSEDYKWLGQTPVMRKMVGGRLAKGFRENGFTIWNDDYEATLRVPDKWLRRDKTGQLMVRIDEMVDRSNSHWAKLLSELIANGTSEVCYDGQYFFDSDHAEGDSGAQSNLITVDISAVAASLHGTATAPSPEEIRAMVLEGVQQLLGLVDDQGEPMNEDAMRFLVQVPVAWMANASAAIKNPVLGGGDTNVMTNLDGFGFELSINPRLDWTDALAVVRTDGSVKPFIRQEEVGVETSHLGDGSDHFFETREHLFGLYASRGVGYGYWQHACRVQAV